MEIDAVEDRVKGYIAQSREDWTKFGQKKWYRAGNTVKIVESDKLAVLTDYGAQDNTIAGDRDVHDQEKLVMEVEPTTNLQQEECLISYQSGKVPRGKDTKFQSIRAFWKERSGEVDQGGQEDDQVVAGEQGEASQSGGGRDEAEEQDQPGVQGGRVQEHGDQLHGQTGGQQQAVATGHGDGDRQSRDGAVLGGNVHHQAVVGDGFQQEFRKIIRAGRKKKAVPEGKIQMLLSKFVVADKNFQNSGRGSTHPSTISTCSVQKRKVVQNGSLVTKRFKP